MRQAAITREASMDVWVALPWIRVDTGDCGSGVGAPLFLSTRGNQHMAVSYNNGATRSSRTVAPSRRGRRVCPAAAALIHFNHMTHHRRCEIKMLTKPAHNTIGTANTISLSAHRNAVPAETAVRVLPPRRRRVVATSTVVSKRTAAVRCRRKKRTFSDSPEKRKQAIQTGVATSHVYESPCGDDRKPRAVEQRTCQHSQGQRPHCKILVNYAAKIRLYTCIHDVRRSLQLYTKLLLNTTSDFVPGVRAD